MTESGQGSEHGTGLGIATGVDHDGAPTGDLEDHGVGVAHVEHREPRRLDPVRGGQGQQAPAGDGGAARPPPDPRPSPGGAGQTPEAQGQGQRSGHLDGGGEQRRPGQEIESGQRRPVGGCIRFPPSFSRMFPLALAS